MTKDPRRVPNTVPFPPLKLVPPITTAAIMFMLSFSPYVYLAPCIRPAYKIPAHAAAAPQITIDQNFTLSVLIPEYLAEDSFPPTASTARPNDVFL